MCFRIYSIKFDSKETPKALYEFSKNKKNIYHLLLMDDLKLFRKSEEELSTELHRNGVWKIDVW